jgi:hypothetical protein
MQRARTMDPVNLRQMATGAEYTLDSTIPM